MLIGLPFETFAIVGTAFLGATAVLFAWAMTFKEDRA
jgi:hypothetical protein